MANDTFLVQGFPNDGLLHDQSDFAAPWMWGLTNQRGSSVTTGNVVIIDTANDESFDVTTTAGDLRQVGVVPYDLQGTTRDGSTEVNDKTIANGEIGAIQIGGYCEEVDVDGAVAAGEYIKTSTTAGKATGTGITMGAAQGAPVGAFGYCLKAGSTTIVAVLFGYTVSAVLNATGKTVLPTSTDDIDSGYSVGSLWIMTSDYNYLTLRCVNNTADNAVWTPAAGNAMVDEDISGASADLQNIPSGYDLLTIIISATPSDDAVRPYLRFNGESDGSDYAWALELTSMATSPAQSDLGDDADSKIEMSTSVGSETDESFQVIIFIPNYADVPTNGYISANFLMVYSDTNGQGRVGYGGAFFLDTAAGAIDQVTFSFAAGTIEEGHWKVMLS